MDDANANIWLVHTYVRTPQPIGRRTACRLKCMCVLYCLVTSAQASTSVVAGLCLCFLLLAWRWYGKPAATRVSVATAAGVEDDPGDVGEGSTLRPPSPVPSRPNVSSGEEGQRQARAAAVSAVRPSSPVPSGSNVSSGEEGQRRADVPVVSAVLPRELIRSALRIEVVPLPGAGGSAEAPVPAARFASESMEVPREAMRSGGTNHGAPESDGWVAPFAQQLEVGEPDSQWDEELEALEDGGHRVKFSALADNLKDFANIGSSIDKGAMGEVLNLLMKLPALQSQVEEKSGGRGMVVKMLREVSQARGGSNRCDGCQPWPE